MDQESESQIINSNQDDNGVDEIKIKQKELNMYVSDSDVDDEERIQPKRLLCRRSYAFVGETSKKRLHMEIDLNKISKEEEKGEDHGVREAAMRRRLDLNKHPIDIGELNSNIEIEDVIVTMLKIGYPSFY